MTISRIIILAGPLGIGKSFLAEQLLNGQWPEMASSIGMINPEDWQCIEAQQVSQIKEPNLDKVLFHYNLLRPWSARNLIDRKSLFRRHGQAPAGTCLKGRFHG